MEALLKWSVLNSATKGEDAPGTSSEHKDPGVIDAILGKSESTLMMENLSLIVSEETSLDAKEAAFDDLEMLVGQVDNAKNLEPMKMWPPLLELLASPEAVIRQNAAWVCGTAIQNNPPAKAAFASHGGVEKIHSLFCSDTEDASVRVKALYCLSGLMQNSPEYVEDIVRLGGFKKMHAVLSNVHPDNGLHGLQRRLLFMLRSLTLQHPASLPRYLNENDIPSAVIALLQHHLKQGEESDEDMIEKGIHVLVELASMSGLGDSEKVATRKLVDEIVKSHPDGLPGMDKEEWVRVMAIL